MGKSVEKSNVKSLSLGFLLGAATVSLTAVIFIWYVLLEAPLPFKVTDPSDPNFDPLKFRYTDYYSETDFSKAIESMFPIGTEKSYVDKILVHIGEGGVKKFNYKHPIYKDKITYRYGYNNPFRKLPMQIIPMPIPLPPANEPSHYVSIDYNEDGKVERVYVMSGIGLPVPDFKKSKRRKQIEELYFANLK
ncbi:MAG: hypothetical protein JAZ11_00130 [Candidatus Thiodiazotropha lotti]|nr:hypothetical protein [Candidatus Thiodiazotropha lotti]